MLGLTTSDSVMTLGAMLDSITDHVTLTIQRALMRGLYRFRDLGLRLLSSNKSNPLFNTANPQSETVSQEKPREEYNATHSI